MHIPPQSFLGIFSYTIKRNGSCYLSISIQNNLLANIVLSFQFSILKEHIYCVYHIYYWRNTIRIYAQQCRVGRLRGLKHKKDSPVLVHIQKYAGYSIKLSWDFLSKIWIELTYVLYIHQCIRKSKEIRKIDFLDPSKMIVYISSN